MAHRDEYGRYVNDEGVIIKVSTDKNGKDHIDFYSDLESKNHEGQHVTIDYDKEKWESHYHDADRNKDNDSDGSGGCYLTTACMESQLSEFNDKCEELEILRWFRDNFVSEDDINNYYNVAPLIVKEINLMDNKKAVYSYIYREVVVYCVNQIKVGNYEVAYKRYKNSVIALENEFVISKSNVNKLVKIK